MSFGSQFADPEGPLLSPLRCQIILTACHVYYMCGIHGQILNRFQCNNHLSRSFFRLLDGKVVFTCKRCFSTERK